MTDILNTIHAKLKQLEETHAVKILFACESGSRAWGFPSPDSDYDVRFVYIHEEDWYLNLHENADVIELPVNEVLDINGWDLRKALRLLSKHNAILYEWMQSPVIYREHNDFISRLKEVAPACFSPVAAMHHYLSMSKRHYDECIAGEKTKLKKYLYCLRSTLSAIWIARQKTIPPMELGKLMVQVSENSLTEKIAELVRLKAGMDESYLHPRDSELELYMKREIEFCEGIAPSLPSVKTDHSLMNAFFRKTIREAV